MGFMQALKADWKKLTTKEGWKQRFAEDEAKRQKPFLFHNGEPVIVNNPDKPDYRVSEAYHAEVLVPRWKRYRITAQLLSPTVLKESITSNTELIEFYRGLEESAKNDEAREKAIVEQVYYTGVVTILKTELEEYSEERYSRNLDRISEQLDRAE